MKRLLLMVLLVGSMLVAAFDQASAAKPAARSGGIHGVHRFAVPGNHMLPVLFFRSLQLVPETTVSLSSITENCNGNGTVSGTITLSGKYTGTIRIALYYHVPGQGSFFPTGATATV